MSKSSPPDDIIVGWVPRVDPLPNGERAALPHPTRADRLSWVLSCTDTETWGQLMKRHSRAAGFLLALAICVSGCDWSQLQFDGGHTSFNPYEPALTASSVRALHPAWSTVDSNSTVVVAGGVVYTALTNGTGPVTAYALSVPNGTVLWTATVPATGHPLAVGNGLVYYGRGSGNETVALDAASGVEKWSSPNLFVALDRTRLFAVSRLSTDGQSDQVVAVNPSGQTVWSVTTGGEFRSAAVRQGQLVVLSFIPLTTAPSGVIVVSTYDEMNGSLVRRVAVPAQDASGTVNDPFPFGMAASGNLIYFNTGGNNLFAADPTSGAVAWRVTLPPAIFSFAVAPNAVVVDHGAGVTALDAATGATLWHGAGSFPFIAGDLVYVDGVRIYDLRTGMQVASTSTPLFTPIPSEGHVFAVASGGLYAMVPSA